MKLQYLKRYLICAAFAAGTSSVFAGTLPRPDHVVIVIMENHSFHQIIGNAAAPNINALAAEGALFVPAASDPAAARSGSHALRHPSQPDYLELFSGDNQGVVGNGYPARQEPLAPVPPFDTANLGAQLIAKGFSFATYSESLPAVGSNITAFTTDRAQAQQYERKHNPRAAFADRHAAAFTQPDAVAFTQPHASAEYAFG